MYALDKSADQIEELEPATTRWSVKVETEGNLKEEVDQISS